MKILLANLKVMMVRGAAKSTLRIKTRKDKDAVGRKCVMNLNNSCSKEREYCNGIL